MGNPKTLGKRWEPGQSGNPAGRSYGSRNKLSERFITALHDDFVSTGGGGIEKERLEVSETYLKLIASVVPREFHFRAQNAFEGMSDDDVTGLVDAARRALAARIAESGGAGSSTPSGEDKPDTVH